MSYLEPKTNNPSPSRLLDSLRSTGYDCSSAVGDILDNAIDAKATQIDTVINYDNKNGYEFIFIDNGYGMDEEILDDALMLGSEKGDYEIDSLGIFGFGLITASIGICKRVEVYTKVEGSEEILVSIQDLDVIYEKNKFEKDGPRKVTTEEKKWVDLYLSEKLSGTVVRWLKCDKLIDPQSERVINSVKNKIANIYRVFMNFPDDSKVVFTMNGEAIDPADPCWINDDRTEIFSDEYYTIKIKNDNNELFEEKIRARLILLPKFEVKQAREYKINEINSGFHLFRNNRVILEGQTLGLFRKNPIRNRFRGEIFFPSSLDDLVGINFTKMKLEITPSLNDQLQRHLGPQVTAINNKALNAMRRTIKKDLNFKDIEKFIAQRSKFLAKPKREKEKRNTKVQTTPKEIPVTQKQKNISVRRRFRRKDIINNLEAKCKFEPLALGEFGPIYSSEQQGKLTIINVNTDHPFYERFMVETEENVDFFNCVGYLLYSMASADGLIEDQDVNENLRPWKTWMSTNLYGLLTTK